MKISTIGCNFLNVKVGDEVYSIRHGDGIVSNVFKNLFFVDFDSFKNFNKSFSFDGKEANFDKYPSLFWTEPELTELPIPEK